MINRAIKSQLPEVVAERLEAFENFAWKPTFLNFKGRHGIDGWIVGRAGMRSSLIKTNKGNNTQNNSRGAPKEYSRRVTRVESSL